MRPLPILFLAATISLMAQAADEGVAKSKAEYKQALRFYADGKSAEGAEKLKAAIQHNPKNVDAFLLLAAATTEEGDKNPKIEEKRKSYALAIAGYKHAVSLGARDLGATIKELEAKVTLTELADPLE